METGAGTAAGGKKVAIRLRPPLSGTAEPRRHGRRAGVLSERRVSCRHGFIKTRSKSKSTGRQPPRMVAVGWYDPEGKRRCKSCGSGSEGRRNADKVRKKIDAELLTSTYGRDHERKSWAEFREEYERRILAGLAVRSGNEAPDCFMNHYERACRAEAHRRPEDPAHRRLRLGPAWGGWQEEGRHGFPRDRQQGAAPRQSSAASGAGVGLPGHGAEVPDGEDAEGASHLCHGRPLCRHLQSVRGGKAAGQPALRRRGVVAGSGGDGLHDRLAHLGHAWLAARDDLDLQLAEAITRGADNKGKRDERVKLHPVVVEHLKVLAGFSSRVFAWNHDQRTLQTEFAKIQEAGGIHLPCARHASAQPLLLRLRFPRSAAGVRHHERRQADPGRTASPHAAPQLPDNASLHQHGEADGPAVASLHVPEVLRPKTA